MRKSLRGRSGFSVLMVSIATAAVGACGDDKPKPPLDQPNQRALLVATTATRAREVVFSTGDGIGFAESDTSFVQKLGNSVGNVPVVSVSKTSPPVAMAAKALPPLRDLFGHPEKARNM